MAKIKVMTGVTQLDSEIKYDDIERLQRTHEEALVMKDEKNNEIFRIGVGEPSVSKYGIVFSAKNAEGNAVVTMLNATTGTPEELRRKLAEEYAENITRLEELANHINSVIEIVEEEIENTMEKIEII